MIGLIILLTFSGFFIKHLFFWKPISVKHFFKNNSPLFIAHRGIHKTAPENTLGAIVEAINLGFTVIELDVCFSFDRKIVCSHNIDLERETGGHGFIDENNARDILKIVCKTIKSQNNKENSIPILKDVFEKFGKSISFIIDVKSKQYNDFKFAKEIIKLIYTYKLYQSVIVSSFNPFILLFIKFLDKKIMTGFLYKNQRQLIITNLIHPDFLHPRGDLINEKVVVYSKRKKIPIISWTINNSLSWNWLSAKGVSGIITDEISGY